MINGDSPNGMLNNIIYFFQCVKNHRVGNSSRVNINTIKLSLEGVETFYKSPSRLLSDAFWNSIDFTDLETQLKGNLNFFDIGCGTGEYGRLIKKLSGDSFGSYVGLDIYKNENFPTEFTHVLDAAKNVGNHIEKKTNVVISQSALEHIEGDLSVLHAITTKLNGNPFVQIHLVPASASLWLFLWHGWRQYSKRNLGQALDTISRDFQISHSIVPLGGSLCYWTHLIYITIPYYLTKRHFLPRTWRWCDHPNVERKIVDAVSNELLSSEKLPTFWAFVIASKDVALKYKS